MPWNCLCSSGKDKRRPQISAPIVDTEDTQKLPLIPLKQAAAIVAAGASSKDASATPTDGTTPTAPADNRLSESPDNNNEPQTKAPKTSGKKAASPKKLNKKQKDKSNSKQQKPAAVAPEKPVKGGYNVQFASEPSPDDVSTITQQPIIIGSPPPNTTVPTPAEAPQLNSEAGNYDILPLIRIDEFDETTGDEVDSAIRRSEFTSFGKTAGSVLRATSVDQPDMDQEEDDGIPFIDAESPQRRIVNYHEERFITLQPRNIGSACMHDTKQRSSAAAATSNSGHRTAAVQFDGSPSAATATQTSPQPPQIPAKTRLVHGAGQNHHHQQQQQHRYHLYMQQQQQQQVMRRAPAVAHHFQVFAAHERRLPTAAKLCQVCHEFLTSGGGDHSSDSGAVVVRCLTCAFVCHQDCVQAKIRYTDTSYVIHQQWSKGGEPATFPLIQQYVQRRQQEQAAATAEAAAAQCRCPKSEPLLNERKTRRRRSRSLERHRQQQQQQQHKRRSGLAAGNSSSGDEADSASETSHATTRRSTREHKPSAGSAPLQPDAAAAVAVADVHHRIDSTIDSTDDGGGGSQLLRLVDINQNVVQPAQFDRMQRPGSLRLNEAAGSVPIRRKQFFEPISDSSTTEFEESSDGGGDGGYGGVDGYETIEFRQEKNYDIQPVVQQNIANAQSYSNAPSPYTSPASHSGAAKSHGGDHLGLQYVTERILASVLPARQRPTTPDNGNNDGGVGGGDDDDDGHVQLRRPPTAASPSSGDENGDGSAGDHYERELVQMLEQKHGKNYKLFDLESCIATVTLERLCELCKHMDAWLGAGREKVVVLQDRGQKQRLGAAIAAYLEYLDICATTTTSGAGGDAANPAIARNWLNLDIFSMKKFLDDVIGPLRVPSHRRYLQYFAGLLSGQIKMNAAPLYLRYVSVDAPPTWLTYDAAVLAANGHRDAAAAAAASSEWRTFVKVYEGLHCVFTSAVHVVPVSTRQFVFEMTGGGGGSGTALRLRGDVIVRCYHIVPSVRVYQERRELIWSAQFHTCACTERTIGFGRAELDYACDDPRFPSDHQITLHFEKTAQAADSAGFLFQSPLVKIEPVTSIAKYDSLENFDDASSQHTQGPLDGSLYATILKSPKTPERPASTFPFPQQQQPAAQRQSAALISPPPEFSNTNIAASSTPSTTVIQHHHHHHHHLQRSQSCTPQPHVHSNNNKNHSSTLQRATYQTPTPPRSSSSQSHYHNFQQQQQQQRSLSRASNGHTNGHHSADAAHALERGQSIRYAQPPASASGATNGGSGNSPAAAVASASADQRRISSGALSVHSPLTLSMDSGIASSGVTTTTTTATHRRVQGSSVSPSSFPSQASPQEDRDRELDDILSDMLQTVKDIPDMANKSGTLKSSAGSGHKNPQNLKIHLTPSPPHHQQHHSSATSSSTTSYYQNAGADYNTDTIKRSPKTQQQQQQLQQQQQQSPVAIDHDQFYETSSTTTTITPPASESGRDTPQQQHHRTSTLSLHSQRDSDRSQYQNLTTVHRQQQQQQQQHTLQPSNGGGSRTHHHHHSNNHHHQQQQQQHGRSDAHHTTSAAQSQSFVYQTQTQHNPQQPRCDSAASTAAYSIVLPSDDTGDDTDDTTDTRSHRSSSTRASHSIPYHAREDSRPFTYGHAAGVQLQSVSEHAAEPSVASSSSGVAAQGTGTATGTGMLKMQSGLSSPSLVRRTLQPVQPQQHKVRNDFEEMLKQRREKVMQDTGGKYTIGDRATAPANGAATSSTTSSYDHHVKWGAEPSTAAAATASSGIGYPYEPLRRSNTMDGGFGRSHSSDGSGPTWLQLQQQKLRAKKQLQTRPGDERVHFVERTATIGPSRPHRSRSSTGRYDGYASDTAAFDTATGAFDEVDYRRPLHVQTPGRQSGGYSLHSSQTMLAHPQTERPFVAVRRAHALHSNGSAQPPLSPLSALYAAPLGQVVQQPTSAAPAASARNGNGNLLLSVASSSDANNNNTISSTTTMTTTMNGGSLNGNGGGSGGNSPASRPNGHTRLTSDNATPKTSPPQHLHLSHHHQQHIPAPLASPTPFADALANEMATGQAALNRLLASLALETDLIERDAAALQLQTTPNSSAPPSSTVGNVFTYPPVVASSGSCASSVQASSSASSSSTSSTHSSSSPDSAHSHLEDVLASLTDYARQETAATETATVQKSSPPVARHLAVKRVLQHGGGGGSESDNNNSASVSPSLSDRSNGMVSWSDQVREESFSSYRSETDPETSLAGSPRPETPAFPVTPRTPYGLNGNGLPSPALPPKSPNTVRKDIYAGGAQLNNNVHFINQNDSMSCYASRRNSNSSTANSEPQDVPSHLVKFVRDSSQFWYKPTISRDEAVALLRHAPPGTFIVRDSTTFAKAYGLVLKVAFPPAGIPARSGPNSDELVRHFLVEPTTRGVRLKGCANEPVFTSLSALVYQHSITPLALPTRLLIPDHEAAYGIEALQQQQLHTPAQQQLLAQGAACNVLYLLTVDTESLTGPEAVRKAVSLLFGRKPLPVPTTVHFKVAQQGVTLTDNTRQLFFRKHYPAANISHCGLDPEDRRWSIRSAGDVPVANKALFAFVARRSGSAHDNQCHVFCELEPTQPATAITSFANKVVPGIGNTPARNF